MGGIDVADGEALAQDVTVVTGGRPADDIAGTVEQRLVAQGIRFGHAVHFDVGNTLVGEEGLDPREQIRREMIAWGYFLGLIIGIILFGFHIAVPVFLVVFLRYRATASWRMTLGLTAISTFILFFAFEHLLHIPLHTGFITDSVMEIIGIGD